MGALTNYAVAIGLCAMVYAYILTEPDMIFTRLYGFLDLWLHEKKNRAMLIQKYKTYVPRENARDYHGLFNVLIGCHRCIAGQWALWYYLFFFPGSYSWDSHIYFICIAILTSHTSKLILLWINRQTR